MATRKQPTGLGRGLGELFQRTDLPAAEEASKEGPSSTPSSVGDELAATGSQYRDIPITAISANPQQPRTVFDPDQLTELAESIKEVGLLQPIVVRPLGDDRYELVMGERRLRASTQAGLTAIPAIIRATEEEDLLRDALLENIHRVQLNPLEEAAAYQQLLSDFGCTQEELAGRIKRSRPQISNTIRLLKLPAVVQKRLAAGVLSAGHARALLGLSDPQRMEQLAQRIVAEGLSVRATEELVTLDQGAEKRPARAPRAKAENPRALTLSAALSDIYDTRVSVSIGRSKGRITIEFAGEDDLDRILSIIDPAIESSTDL
ncbi:MAG: ParB/RepB/Spo0J family partition protein [Propionibacteriaceae bacterium]|nr:ParB/RepB/Spo0J family partition protein [Propionibacteriaceae bacterium]